MSLGQRIKEQRKLLGINQQELADKIGMSLNSIKRMETDRMIPSLETFQKLVDLFAISADYLLGNYSGLEYGIDLETGKAKISVLRQVDPNDPSTLSGVDNVKISPELLKGRKTLAYQVEDDSMSGDNIYKGDVVVIVKTDKFLPRDILFLIYSSNFYLRRFSQTEDLNILTASNPDFAPIVLNRMQEEKLYRFGKVVQIIKNL